MVMAIEHPPNILADNSERQHYDSLCSTVVPELVVQPQQFCTNYSASNASFAPSAIIVRAWLEASIHPLPLVCYHGLCSDGALLIVLPLCKVLRRFSFVRLRWPHRLWFKMFSRARTACVVSTREIIHNNVMWLRQTASDAVCEKH